MSESMNESMSEPMREFMSMLIHEFNCYKAELHDNLIRDPQDHDIPALELVKLRMRELNELRRALGTLGQIALDLCAK